MEGRATPEGSPGKARTTYALVFLALAAVTALEVGLTFVGLPRGLRNGVFLLLSLAKAALVAAFYMHLRSEARLYRYVFLLPVVLLLLFAILQVVA